MKAAELGKNRNT